MIPITYLQYTLKCVYQISLKCFRYILNNNNTNSVGKPLWDHPVCCHKRMRSHSTPPPGALRLLLHSPPPPPPPHLALHSSPSISRSNLTMEGGSNPHQFCASRPTSSRHSTMVRPPLPLTGEENFTSDSRVDTMSPLIKLNQTH